MAAREDELRRLSGLLERIAAREVDVALRDAVEVVRPRAVRLVSDLLTSELISRLEERGKTGTPASTVGRSDDTVDLTDARSGPSPGSARYVYAVIDYPLAMGEA